MIGDRPDTDILLGHNASIDTCIVLTGVVRSEIEMEHWINQDPRVKPTYIMQSFGKFTGDEYLSN